MRPLARGLVDERGDFADLPPGIRTLTGTLGGITRRPNFGPAHAAVVCETENL
jgi:hypothetical protein